MLLKKANLRRTRKGYAANSKALKRQELRNRSCICLLAYNFVRVASQALLFLASRPF